MDQIEYDVTNSTLTADNILLYPDSVRAIELEQQKLLGNELYTIRLKKLYIKGLSPFDLIKGNDIDLKQITLDSPDVKIVHKKRDFHKDTTNLYSKIIPTGKSWQIHNLLAQDIRLSFKNLDKNNFTKFKNITASFTDILIDSTTRFDSTRFMFARDAVLSLKKYSTGTNDKMYMFSIDSIALKPQRDIATAFGIRLKPILNKEQFSRKLPYLKDRYNISVKSAFVKNINWWKLLTEGDFYGSEMTIRDGSLEVYEDLRLPKGPNKKMGTYPSQLLMKIKVPLQLPKINISDFKVVYEEFNPASGRSGSITFNHIDGQIYNFTNMPAVIARSPFIKINATARLMNAGLMKANLVFNMHKAADGDFSARATLGNMDGKIFNGTAETLGLLKIKNGMLDNLQADITGSNAKAEGTIIFIYHDLDVELLRKNADGEIKNRGLLSFLAKTLVLKKSNPSGDKETRIQTVVTDNSDGKRTFFNLIWKTISDGMLITVRGKATVERLLGVGKK
jgi:hypothetical protein